MKTCPKNGVLTKAIYAILFSIVLMSSSQSNRVYICISSTATKYHDHYCQGLKQCTHQIKEVSISEAKQLGYGPCGFCY
jgi:hypothetical protein